MDQIKADRNASEALDQNQMASISCVTYKAHDVVKSRRSILDPMDVT